LQSVPIAFSVAEPEAYYHIPLPVTPCGFSTYRGSQPLASDNLNGRRIVMQGCQLYQPMSGQGQSISSDQLKLSDWPHGTKEEEL
jgi:hypothetical protein